MLARIHQLALDHVLLGGRPGPDGHIGLQPRDVELVIGQEETQADIGEGGVKPGQTRRQPDGAQRRGRGNPQQPAGLVAHVLHRAFGQRHPAGDVARSLEQDTPRLGEQEPARMAVEELDAEALLQRGDLPAHRRLGQVERLRRAGKGARLGGGVEGFQLVPVHVLRGSYTRIVMPSASDWR